MPRRRGLVLTATGTCLYTKAAFLDLARLIIGAPMPMPRLEIPIRDSAPFVAINTSLAFFTFWKPRSHPCRMAGTRHLTVPLCRLDLNFPNWTRTIELEAAN